jgi:DNA-binding LacI/PurR family transcriptional regulator
MPLPANRIRHCHQADADDLKASAKWLANLKPRPTAGLIFSASAAMVFMTYLGDHGLSCPADVSLIGKAHSNQPVGDTTVLVNDLDAMGRAAADLISERSAEKRKSPVVYALRSWLRRGRTVRCLPL